MEILIQIAFIRMEEKKEQALYIIQMEILIQNAFIRIEEKKENT